MRYELKILSELAILRQYYGLSRKQALKLPNWEWKSLLRERLRIEAEKVLNQLYTSSAGFNGGELSTNLQDSLREQMSYQDELNRENPLLSVGKFFGDSITL